MGSGPRSKALAGWLVRERAANRSAILLLVAMVVPAGLAVLSAGSFARSAAAATAVALGAGGWVWLTRCASRLRRTLDTLVNEDRLGRKHDGVVDAYVVQWIKDGRRFGFERLPKMRYWLAAVTLACVASALVPPTGAGDQLPTDVVALVDGVPPDTAAGTESKLLASAKLVASGDAALRTKNVEVARERFEKAYAIRQALHQLTPEDAHMAAAVLVIEARLARVACLEGDPAAAAKHIESALHRLRQSASKARQDFEGWLLTARTQQQQGRCQAGST